MRERFRSGWAAWCALKRSIMWQLLVNQKRWIWLLAGISTLAACVAGLVALTIRDFIDLGIIDKARPIEQYSGALVFLAILGFGLGFATRQVASRIGYHLEFELRTWLYHRLQSMDPRALDALATGQVVTRALTDLSVLELAILLIPTVAVGVTLLTGLAIILLFLNPLMAVISFAAMPVNYVLIKRIQRRLWALSWLTLNRRAEVTTAIDEPVRGIRVVKAFGREEYQRRTVKERAQAAYAVALSRVRLVARYDMFLKALPIALNAVLLLVGGRLLVRGDFTVGTLLIFLVVTSIFTGFASSFDEIASGWQYARTGSGRIFELVAVAPPERADPDPDPTAPGPRPLPEIRTGLDLRGVGYAPSGRTLVDGVELAAEPGRLTVLTGGPGSGKSLVATIAAGGLRPTSGSVLLDGEDIFAIDPHAVRAAVRLLSEEPFLFGRTVRENLSFTADGVPPTDDELRATLAAAAADGIVDDLPDGLDAKLGDRGYTLSGGQRQRLALARALVRLPRVLILDDALSAVNPSLEIDILHRIRALAPETALISISRRPDVAAAADNVVMLATVLPAGPGTALLRNLVDRDGPGDPDLAAAVAELAPDADVVEVDERAATDDAAVPSVRGILQPFKGRVAVAGVFLVLLTLASLLPEGLFKLAVDDFVDGRNSTADKVGITIAVLGLAIGGFSYFFKVFGARVTEGVMYVLRRRTFQRLSRLGVDYYDRNLPGQVAARVVHDLDRISLFIETGVFQLAVALTLLVAATGVVLVWSPPIAAIMITFIVLALIVTAVQLPAANRAYLVARARLGEVVERFQEDFAGRYVIDAYGARPIAYGAFHERAWALRQARRRATTISNAYLESVQFFAALATAGLLSRAGNLHVDGVISVGSVISLELYLTAVVGPLPLLSSVLQNYLAARASFRALAHPYQEPVLPIERPEPLSCPSLAGHLSIDHVTFRYPGTARAVLDDVSLDIPTGAVVALVGPTGAGKSSIAKLAARVYDPDSGVVRADGVDIRDYDLDSYRRRLGIVPQDAFCFRGTVASNISYGRPDADRTAIEAAARAVGGYKELAALPGGLDATVEEEGRNLSAAQRQYVALARAVLVEPDVLVLDEATSNLDEAAEHRVLDAIRSLGLTTIFITHRLSVARTADTVVVVDRGQVVETGTHTDLTATGRAYRRLWSAGPDVELTSGALQGAGATEVAR